MKRALKYFLLQALLLLLPETAGAQTHFASNISVGVKGGVDLSQVFFTPSVPQKWALGAVAGVTFKYVEENHFGLIAELDFVQRGWSENFEEVPYRYKRTLNYIEIPVLAHIYFGRRGRFFINAGPQIGFLLGESTSANFDPADTSSLPDFPNTNRTNSQMTIPASQKIDFGISAGVGGEFNINRRNAVNLEARFYYGLGNVLPSKRTDIFRGSNQMSLAVTLGYSFRVK